MKNRIFLFTMIVLSVNISKGQHSLPGWHESGPSGLSQFKNFNVYTHNTALDGSYVNFNAIENTKGRRYLFDGWATGKVFTTNGQVFDSDSMFYNMDKMNSDLLVTTDKKNIIAVNKADIKSFILSDGKVTYTFDRIDVINPQGLLQVLVKKDNGYTLYRSITTKFQKADYHTDGLMESGKPYDEYSDQYKYFVVFPDGKGYKQVNLKGKSIKDVFKADPKSGEFFDSNKVLPVNEEYLISLVQFLNQ